MTIAPKVRYYPLQRNWTRKIVPHLGNARLRAVLVRDFNKFTYGRWRSTFKPGELPAAYESCDWFDSHRGRPPRYWSYVKHSACHWTVNCALELAQLAEPKRPWRIITSQLHSTV